MTAVPTREVKKLEDLSPADHIIIEESFMKFPYQHHGIITSVQPEKGTFNMVHYVYIHFSRRTVLNTEMNFKEYNEKGIYIVEYEGGDYLGDEIVLERAQKCIGKKGFHVRMQTSKEIALHCKVGNNAMSRALFKSRDNEKRLLYGPPCLLGSSPTRVDIMTPRVRIDSLSQLRPADHIIVSRSIGGRSPRNAYAIVMSTCEESDEVQVVTYGMTEKDYSRKVVRESKRLGDLKGVLRIEYEEGQAYSKDEVLAKAIEFEGKTNLDDLDIADCVEMARACKTQQRYSSFSLSEVATKAVTSIDDFCLGDHIIIHKSLLPDHHAIVVSIDEKNELLDIVHYTQMKAPYYTVHRVTDKFTNMVKGSIVRIDYDPYDCLCESEVLSRAESCVGDENYDWPKRTDEELGYFIKIGSPLVDSLASEFEEIRFDIVSSQQPRVTLTLFSQLRRADHIVYPRAVFGHHAIVLNVSPPDPKITSGEEYVGKYEVIHYQPALSFCTTEEKSSKWAVRRDIKWFDEKKDVGTVYVVQYKSGECFDDDTVIANAEKLVDEKKYSLFSNNCESFAVSCKVGLKRTEQVKRVLLAFGMAVQHINGRIAPGLLASLADDIAATLLRSGSRVASRALGAGMAALGGVMEVGFTAYDINKYCKQRREGKMNERKFRAKMVTRPIAGGTAVGGGVAGAVIGGIIAPVAGMFVGGLIGGFAGGIIPRAVLYGVEKTGYLEDVTYITSGRLNTDEKDLPEPNEEEPDANMELSLGD